MSPRGVARLGMRADARALSPSHLATLTSLLRTRSPSYLAVVLRTSPEKVASLAGGARYPAATVARVESELDLLVKRVALGFGMGRSGLKSGPQARQNGQARASTGETGEGGGLCRRRESKPTTPAHAENPEPPPRRVPGGRP
jgi:hypothetical protein